MLSTRFIFVEGIPGSGKSTTAEFLTSTLLRRGGDARFVAEGPTRDSPDHPLRVATSLPHPNAVWLDVTVAEFVERSLRRWRAFAQRASASATITICDGLLFHGNMTDLLLMDAEPDVLRRYVRNVAGSLRDLNPVVIYLLRPDVATALRAVCDERGEDWEAYQLGWKLESPYAARRSLRGFRGLVTLYEDYRAICDDLFASLPLPKLEVRTEGDWSANLREFLAFLRLPVMESAEGVDRP